MCDAVAHAAALAIGCSRQHDLAVLQTVLQF